MVTLEGRDRHMDRCIDGGRARDRDVGGDAGTGVGVPAAMAVAYGWASVMIAEGFHQAD